MASIDLVSSQANDTSLLDWDARRTVTPLSAKIRATREPAFPVAPKTRMTGEFVMS